jgi:hypothetical protein
MLPGAEKRSGPSGESGAAEDRWTATPTKVHDHAPDLLPVTGVVRIDLSHEDLTASGYDQGRRDRWKVMGLEGCPDGARVVVSVGARTFIWPDTARELHRQARRLHIEVDGTDPRAVGRWITAVRTGEEVI